jgi:hypothetical protein
MVKGGNMVARAARRVEAPLRRLLAGEAVKFTALAALLAILADASLGHGLTWENDPYWTYWVTKTFLIATVIGLGTAWFGIGVGRGALIVLVHTLILTTYYWSLSPIGLPSSPHWLDLEHTWISGVPIHFGVIYLGYLVALWIWRRRARLAALPDSGSRIFGAKVLLMSLLIVGLAGALSNLALGEFTGVTWYVVRLLITVPFIMLWRTIAGHDRISSLVGGIILALMWATYSQYLGPVGLPDIHHLRIFSQAAPPSPVHWLDYNQLWLISFPIYVVVMIGLLMVGSYQNLGLRWITPAIIALLAMAAITIISALAIPAKDKGSVADIKASQGAVLERGAYYGNQFQPAAAKISIHAKDAGDRVSPLPPHDEVNITAEIKSGGHSYSIIAKDPMVDDPMGQFTTWWGVGLDVWHHGDSGIGTNKLPAIHSKLAAFAMGDIKMDGQLVAVGVPVHVMTAQQGFADNKHLELDVGDPRTTPLPNIPSGHLRVLWNNYKGNIPGASAGRYIGGDIVLGLLLIGGLWLNGLGNAIFRSPARR